ncbi:MAG: YraN family protein [Candidatus Cloacimonetes bacterium]|jgi:putative endonuclease|nr:YraN family protein [Candidatus Cloacimonadota bacterium]HNZ07454.1 YraN family protein [Candidatus Cloacimonadota bacterium]HOH79237.1 YraN family protein [Candidatus Cloacimonadota bacterium]HPN41066.1 YraN family protein [Candidatus Cloacimonadota bacterium]
MDRITQNAFFHIGEDIAAKFLLNKGYELLCKNFRIRNGEIDIIMRSDTHLIFVEVKTRRFHSIDAALQTVTWTKRRNISRTAQEYINQNPDYAKLQTRFDIVLVFYEQASNSFSVKHFPDAFYPVFDR